MTSFFFLIFYFKARFDTHLGPVHPSLAHLQVTSFCACLFLDFWLLSKGRHWPLGPKRHAATLYITILTLNFSHGSPLTTRVPAHAPACKVCIGWLKIWFFPDKWLVAMVIFYLRFRYDAISGFPFWGDLHVCSFTFFGYSTWTAQIITWSNFGLLTLTLLHQSEARKIQHGRLFYPHPPIKSFASKRGQNCHPSRRYCFPYFEYRRDLTGLEISSNIKYLSSPPYICI